MAQSKYVTFPALCVGLVLLFTSLSVGMSPSVSMALDPDEPFKLASISSGKHHSCGVATDGTVWCWGLGTSGQMGDLSTSNNTTPNRVSGVSTAVSVSAGGSHTCLLSASGGVGCWGSNAFGQLGNPIGLLNETSTASRPYAQVVNGITASAISAGGNHTCALLTDATVSCWGSNVSGQLGIGTKINRNAPAVVPGLQDVISIATGEDQSCALLSDRSVKCWGANWGNQIGSAESMSPIILQGFTGVTQLALGFGQTCAVLTNKTVKCVGSSLDYATQSSTPYLVPGFAGVSYLAHFGGHMCAVVEGFSVRCVGENQRMQLGDRTSITRTTAVSTVNISDAVSVSVGWWHTCALLTTGFVKCWGNNGYGQLGQGSFSNNTGLPRYVKLLHTLSFGELADVEVGASSVVLVGSMSSGAGVNFRSLTSSVCEVSGDKLIAKSSGMCSVEATPDESLSDFFVTSRSLRTVRQFSVGAWSGSRNNSVTTFKIKTNDGSSVTGVRLTWSTLDAENPASGSANITNSSGTVTMSTISGPAIIRVSSLYHDGLNTQFDKKTVSQYLYSFSTVKILGNGEILIDLGTRPVPSERNFTVRLSDGTPVRGAQVFLAVTTNAWLDPSRTVSGSHLNGFAKWNTSNQIDRAEPCFNDGNSFYDSSGTNVRGVTDVNGSVSLKVYQSSGVENLITTCYNDSEFTQKRTVSIASSGTTSIALGYMARVNVSVSTLSVSSGGTEYVSAQVVDANGNAVSSQSVQVMAGSVDATATALTCAGSQGTTNANGYVMLKVCPSASGNYFLRSNGALSSRLIYVTVGSGSPANNSGGTSSPAPKSGGGGGDDEEDAAPVVAAPKATAPKPTPSSSTLAPRISVPTPNAKAPVIPSTAGTVVPNLVQPKAAVAQGLAIAATSNKVTIALKSPVATTSTAKISSYVVTVRSSTGAIVKRLTVAVKTAGQTVSPAIAIAKSGNYVIEISGKNSKGKVLGTYKSAAIKVGK
jgi:alpha-tubulin suppressor-like RCC1 family protein